MSLHDNIEREFEKLNDFRQFDVEGEWDKFVVLAGIDTEDQIDDSKSGSNLLRNLFLVLIPLLLFGAIFLYINKDQNVSPEPIDLPEPTVLPEIETPAQPEEKKPSVEDKPKAIAQVIQKNQKQTIHRPKTSWSHDKKFGLITTTHESKTFVLKDGTHITMAPQSILSYRTGIENEIDRQISIFEGSAEFDVVSYPNKSLNVTTDYTGIEVLGTIFIVDLNDNQVGVQNKQGIVEFYEKANRENKVLLQVGDQYAYSKETGFINLLEEASLPEPISEPEGLDENRSTYRFSDVVKYLEKQYKGRFKKHKKCKINKEDAISLNLNKSLDELMLDLEKYADIEYTREKCDDCYLLMKFEPKTEEDNSEK